MKNINIAARFVIFTTGAIIMGLVTAGSVFSSGKRDILKKGNAAAVLSPDKAGQEALSYINKYIVRAGEKASLIKIEEEDGVYKFRLKIGGKEYDSYVTKNGKILFPNGIDLTLKPEERKIIPQKIPKRDRPDIKLFVMSYCPFGLQMEKAFLPVYKLLKDKADMGVYFVDYAMHGKKEIEENLRQYCIQKEEKEKYYDYLSCFTKDNNFKKCLSIAGIDRAKLAKCTSETDKKYNITEDYNNKNTYLRGRFPKVQLQAGLNKKYKIRGSPTVVINDKVVRIYSRSPEKFKEAVCRAFNSPPEECSVGLSRKVVSAGCCGHE